MGKSELSKMLISKKNEVYLRLTDVEPSIAAELNDFFTFEVPGFKYMPAYRSKMWDGKIRLYNIVTGEIYVGLLPYIEEYLNNNGEGYEFADGITSKRDVARSVVQGFVRGLRPTLNGKRIISMMNHTDTDSFIRRSNITHHHIPTKSIPCQPWPGRKSSVAIGI